MEKNEGVKIANQQLKEISEEEINQRIAELREKARRDDVAIRLTGERIGREKAAKEYEERIAELKRTGERIGREKAEKEFEEKNKNIIFKLLDLNITIDEISKITGLSTQEIEKISNIK